jgi:hypothetical protein
MVGYHGEAQVNPSIKPNFKYTCLATNQSPYVWIILIEKKLDP